MGKYTIWLDDTSGNRLEDISAFISLDYAKVENATGALTLVVPATFDRKLLTVDARIEVLRTNADKRVTLEGNTIWLLQDWSIIYNGSVPQYQLTAVDANHLLERRYIPYAADTSYTTKTTYADDIMKAIMRENYGTLAKLPTEVPPTTLDTARDISAFLSIAANISQAPSITQSFAQAKILDALKQIVSASGNAGTELFFDIVAIDAKTLEFRTFILWRGTDRRIPNSDIIFSPQNNTLFNAKVTTQYNKEVNYVYAKGQGQGAERTIVTASDTARIAKSPLNRKETMIDGRMNSSPTALQADANAALYAGKPKILLEAELRDTENAQYNVAWSYGDYIPVTIGDYSFNAHVTAVNVSAHNNGQETIKAIIKAVI